MEDQNKKSKWTRIKTIIRTGLEMTDAALRHAVDTTGTAKKDFKRAQRTMRAWIDDRDNSLNIENFRNGGREDR